MKNPETFETGCCPRFNPKSWDNKEITFKDKLFLKDHVNSLFHIPLNFGAVMERGIKKIEAAHAVASEQLVLSDETSLWGADVYIAVDKEVPKAHMEKISGTFLTKVFEGSYRNMGKNVEEMKTYVKSKGKDVKKLYFYYTYCPKCAEAYGKNYTVILAQV
ncbi:MAG: hypothetical protein HYU68_08330 [Bacteroidetes bacterium]|nr:hypothetical protein [Bacteroidota bacterium]